jgi:hypothetical protein
MHTVQSEDHVGEMEQFKVQEVDDAGAVVHEKVCIACRVLSCHNISGHVCH